MDRTHFYLRFQPIIRAQTGEVAGAEALLRWKSDEHGEVAPGRFIAFLENDPAYEPLGYDIIRFAVRTAGRIRETLPGFRINVNITAIQLLSDDFIPTVARILEEGRVNKPGLVNSVNEEGTKCETIFPIIAGTPWEVIGLTCDQDGIPTDSEKKVEIAKRIIDKANKYGVALNQLHIDPCVMALATMPSAMDDFVYCIEHIHAFAPEVKVTGAISNISFNMPARKYVNNGCLAYALGAGLDSGILDPCNEDMLGTIYACEALKMVDKAGRKYNRAFRKGLFGQKK
jgi:5-methyltetrahydrofolate--homocysteine methyltransferase